MTDLAAQLTDRVLPHVPVRQWVLTFPWTIRFLLAFDPELQKEVRRIFLSTILRWMEKRAERVGLVRSKGGAVNLVQRFGSALNLNLHFHAVFLGRRLHHREPIGETRVPGSSAAARLGRARTDAQTARPDHPCAASTRAPSRGRRDSA